ncbi:Ca2+-transporting ATPase [Oxalobacteraceae bacterium GrIS 1.11]
MTPVEESAPQGLSQSEAAERLKQDGHNELPGGPKRTIWHIAFEVTREPMFLLLLAAGAIYLALGDAGDAAMLLGFVLVSMSITIVQERRTERVLETLRDLSSPRALVLRGGAQVRIPGREVVKGDLLVLEEGDRVAADGALLECHDLLIDESLLTGESVAVAKLVQGDAEAGQVCSGTMVVQGGGLARVLATGGATRIGAIGRSLQALGPQVSPLQREIGTLVKRFACFGVALSLLVLLLFGWSRHDWMAGLLAGITLAMSVLPEEFTVILTVFMALGAWRISKSRVLTRHTPVIEALGAATVLCVDKTGTLTENRMSVDALLIGAQTLRPGQDDLPPAALALIDCAVLASEIAPFDPMDLAFHACQKQFSAVAPLATLVHEYPLTPAIMAMTHVWQTAAGAILVASKGAPEAVAALCRLDAAQTAGVLAQVQTLAAQGMRVLGVASAVHAGGEAWPPDPGGFAFAWLGLVGLADPIRPTVAPAVAQCHRAGIRVVMITGDYPATAQAIARAAGLQGDCVVTGAELAAFDDAELDAALRRSEVFARIRPEQKLRLVQAFKAAGEVVAMTGDGVNDAPALKAAHIGIGMGLRGTDVAREASSLVLLDDDFASIVRAIALGRRIYDNLRKALGYVVAVHLPIAGMTLLPLLLGGPLAFAPVHIVFMEMIINPASAIVFEAEEAEADIMLRPPRSPLERLFGARRVLAAVLQGLGLLGAVAAVFFLGLRAGLQEGQARAAAFACLVIGNLGLIVVNRAGSALAPRAANPALWYVCVATCAALAAVLLLPPLQRVFHFSSLPALQIGAAILAGLATVLWFQLVKWGAAKYPG